MHGLTPQKRFKQPNKYHSGDLYPQHTKLVMDRLWVIFEIWFGYVNKKI